MSHGRRVYPPVYFLGSVLILALLRKYFPLIHLWEPPVSYFGWVVIGVAVLLAVVSSSMFRRHDTAIKPFQDSRVLMTTGPYRFSRNPIYLSMTTLLVGGAVVSGAASPWFVPGAFAFLIQKKFIEKEEEHLRQQFGSEYDEYCGRVRRWL